MKLITPLLLLSIFLISETVSQNVNDDSMLDDVYNNLDALRKRKGLYESLYKPRKVPKQEPEDVDEDTTNWRLIRAILPKMKRLPWDWILNKVRQAIRKKLDEY